MKGINYSKNRILKKILGHRDHAMFDHMTVNNKDDGKAFNDIKKQPAIF